MQCPHCGADTPIEQDKCVACGQSVSVAADAVQQTESAAEEKKKACWGPTLLRYCVGLVILACVLGFGASYLEKRPLTRSTVEKPALHAPGPDYPMPSPPKSLPSAPVIEPVDVGLPSVPKVEMAFGSRDPRVRRLFLERNGGDAQTEAAVELGLKWLKAKQEPDGHWACERVGGQAGNSLGVTGLALLAFLGAGHSHMADGPHKDAVAKALDYVLRQQNAKGLFPGKLYHQGICTMAVVEAHGMTGDSTLIESAQRAVAAIVAAQNKSGGWDYGPVSAKNRGDTSVTGWQVMALKSALRVGLDVPKNAMVDMRRYLASVTRDGAIGYSNIGDINTAWRTTPALTAAGLNAHLFAGGKADEPDIQKAISILLDNLPKEPRLKADKWAYPANIYFWYHGSLALCRLGGLEWTTWNNRLKSLLLKLQRRSGAEAGSWNTCGDPFTKSGGDIYFTSMTILALEVYYRYD